MDRLEIGTYVRYCYVVEGENGDEEYWYYGKIEEIKEEGIGDDGDKYKVAVVEFPKEDEVDKNVTFWKVKAGIAGALGWSVLGGEGELKEREKVEEDVVSPSRPKRAKRTREEANDMVQENEQKNAEYFRSYKDKKGRGLDENVARTTRKRGTEQGGPSHVKKGKQEENVEYVSRGEFQAFQNAVQREVKVLKDDNKGLKVNEIKMKQEISRWAYLFDQSKRDISKANLMSYCARFKPVMKLPQGVSQVYPAMLASMQQGHRMFKVPGWNQYQCTNMFVWENERPRCRSAKWYDTVATETGSSSIFPTGNPTDKSFWLMPGSGSAHPFGYHTSLSIFTRDKPATDAVTDCMTYGFCRGCMQEKDEFISWTKDSSRKQSQCAVCCRHTTITTTDGSQDVKVDVCTDCFTAVGSKDNLGYAFRMVKHLFPLKNVRTHTDSITIDGKTWKPDTTIEFTTDLTQYFIFIEMDTSQHDKKSKQDEVDKKEDIARYTYRDNPDAKVLFIRFCPGGSYRNDKGEVQDNVPTTAQRVIMLRQWVIWYIATTESVVPKFLVLYLWYNYECGKISLAKERFGTAYVGQSFGYPAEGVWQWYGISPHEQVKVQKWTFETTGCLGEHPKYVFLNYDRFCDMNLELPECLA